MRILAVHPGPDFSVADVHRGWVNALSEVAQVVDYELNVRLQFFEDALRRRDGDNPDGHDIAVLAAEGILAAALKFQPDAILITSGFYVPPEVWATLKARGFPIVLLATESPYEDDGQLQRAPYCDLVLLNDPTNLDKFREVTRAEYVGHAYDPARHFPAPPDPRYVSDFAFVGTGYPSRREFLAAVDWTGIDVLLAGNWQNMADDNPLKKFVAHDIDESLGNEDTVRVYQSTKISANLYRQEAQRVGLVEGWSVGPREIELAATGTFFLREPRPESDLLFPMLPTFTTPGDFGEKLRWWLSHDVERESIAEQARRAVANRTFETNAKRLLRWLDRIPPH